MPEASNIEIHFGTDLLIQIAEACGLRKNPPIIFTQPPQWDNHRTAFENAGFDVSSTRNVIPVPGVEQALSLLRSHPLEEAVLIGFGGGQCCDAAKYAAWYLEHIEQRIPSEGSGKLPFERVLCIEVPSVVSVDAFLCEAVAAQSRAIIDDLLAVEEKIRRVTPEGVRAIVEGYVHEIDLCTGWGNSRPEEGSEHFFAYNYEYLCTAENRREHILHGELVGLGLFVQAAAQGEYAAEPGRGAKPERATEIVETMDALGLNWAPEAVDPEMISKAMKTLRSYCEGESLPFSVANVFEYPDEFCERVLEEIEKQQARRSRKNN